MRGHRPRCRSTWPPATIVFLNTPLPPGHDLVGMLRRQHERPVRVAEQELVEPGQRQHRALRRGRRRRAGRPSPGRASSWSPRTPAPPAGPSPGPGPRGPPSAGMPDHQEKSRSVAGPWLRRYRSSHSAMPSARSRVRDPVIQSSKATTSCWLPASGPCTSQPRWHRIPSRWMPRWPAVDWPARSKAWNSSARLAAAPPETSCSAVSAATSTSAAVDLQLPVAPGHAPDQPVGGDGQHPVQVLGCQQVQRAAHRPGPDDLAPVQGAADIRRPGIPAPAGRRPRGPPAGPGPAWPSSSGPPPATTAEPGPQPVPARPAAAGP